MTDYRSGGQAQRLALSWAKSLVRGIAVGHHHHFVSDDLKSGGHALSFTTGQVTVEIQVLTQQTIWLPTTERFLNAALPFVPPMP